MDHATPRLLGLVALREQRLAALVTSLTLSLALGLGALTIAFAVATRLAG